MVVSAFVPCVRVLVPVVDYVHIFFLLMLPLTLRTEAFPARSFGFSCVEMLPVCNEAGQDALNGCWDCWSMRQPGAVMPEILASNEVSLNIDHELGLIFGK